MVKGFAYPVARFTAGRYCYRGRYIIRTSWEDTGPRGGTHYLWELGTEDKYGAVNLDGAGGFRTMRDAMAEVDKEHEHKV